MILNIIILFFSVIAGGLLYFAIKQEKKILLLLALSFSGAFLFALCVLELIPSLYQSNANNIGIYILLGFFLQIILDYFSQGIEHGHIHIEKKHSTWFPLVLMAGLCIHAFLEGMPLAINFEHSTTHQHSHSLPLLWGIALHHIPVAFALVSMLVTSKVSIKTTLILLVVFAAMSPLGNLTGVWLKDILFDDTQLYQIIMAVVIGIFLHISTTILFETGDEHNFNLKKLVTIIAGAFLAYIIT